MEKTNPLGKIRLTEDAGVQSNEDLVQVLFFLFFVYDFTCLIVSDDQYIILVKVYSRSRLEQLHLLLAASTRNHRTAPAPGLLINREINWYAVQETPPYWRYLPNDRNTASYVELTSKIRHDGRWREAH
jgi:hypothetical protein